MKFKIQNKELDQLIGKFQEGGVAPEAAPAEEPAAPEQGGGDPMEQILQAAVQAVQTQDAQLALQVCQALVQMAGGGAAPAEQAPPGEPVYRRGGRLVRFQKKG